MSDVLSRTSELFVFFVSNYSERFFILSRVSNLHTFFWSLEMIGYVASATPTAASSSDDAYAGNGDERTRLPATSVAAAASRSCRGGTIIVHFGRVAARFGACWGWKLLARASSDRMTTAVVFIAVMSER